MSPQWKDLNSLTQQSVMRGFVNQAVTQDWAEQFRHISLRQLYAYALNAKAPYKSQILFALQRDPLTQRSYVEILHHLKACPMVSAAVNGDGAFAEGRSAHWHYQMVAASAPLSESYLIIEIAAGTPSPSRLFARSPQNGSTDIELEKSHRGLIHMVLQNTDPLVKILRDTDREVMLW